MKTWLQPILRQLRWQGFSGIFLLLVIWAFFIVELHPLEQQVALNREKTQQAHRNFGTIENSESTPAIKLAKFYDFLASEKLVTNELAKIYRLADANNLELRKGEYQLVHDKDSRLSEYRISLPVKGNYAKIRTFTTRTLEKIPSLSLDSIKFQRKQSAESSVEAEIRFTLYLYAQS